MLKDPFPLYRGITVATFKESRISAELKMSMNKMANGTRKAKKQSLKIFMGIIFGTTQELGFTYEIASFTSSGVTSRSISARAGGFKRK
jgi:hypothetical protein